MALEFTFADTINSLKEMGVFDYVLPFLLIFAIIFAILEKTKILGNDKSNINTIVAGVIALLVLAQQGIVQTINLFLPRVSLLIVVILMGLLVIAMLAGGEFKGLQGGLFAVGVIVVIIAIVFAVTLPDTGAYGFSLSSYDRQVILMYLFPIGLLVGAIALVTMKPSSPDKKSGFSKLIESIDSGYRRS